MANHDNYRLLIEKLDQFTRKFYVNQLIRGSLYSVGLILALFLGMSLLENYFFFPSGGRKLLFFSFIGISFAALSVWVITPLLHYFRLGKLISHEQAAQIIGSHFGDVKDKLLNILQLHNQVSDQANLRELILASINQKSEEIKPVPFKAAINLSNNKKYLRYALPPLLLLLIILFAAPSIIKESANRLIHSNREFSKPAPFQFVVNTDSLSVVQFQDYQLNVKVEGNQLPNEVFIEIDDYQYRLTKDAANLFSYKFSNVQKDVEFYLYSSGVNSQDFTLDVLEKPNVVGFEVKLDYPSYTQRPDETLNSTGDLVVPQGTQIDWIFNTQFTDQINLYFSTQNTTAQPAKRFSDDLFTYKRKAMRDELYKLFISNKKISNADSISYTITVIPDLYPNISVEKIQDSTNQKLLFFLGEASDDYGLLNLAFNYRIKRQKSGQGAMVTTKLPKPNGKQARYNYTFDVETLGLQPGDEVTYYFEVFDNDGVNGSKSAKTNVMVYAMPTVEEFKNLAQKNNDEIKDNLKKALEESKKIQEDMKKVREKLLQEKDLDWQNRKELEKLLDRQKELEKQIEESKQSFEENLKNQEEYSEVDESIREKQEQLQKLFDEALSEEMKKMMEEIEEMLEKMEKDGALEKMEDMQLSDEEMEKELDRMLEMFKQLEVEQQIQETIDELQKLAEEQEKLSEQTENKELKQEELEQKQEDINEKFDDIQEKMDELEKKNEELENPKELGDQEQEKKEIEDELKNSQQQIQQQQNSKASKSQKKAAGKMKNMANSLSMSMQAGEMQQMQEDMASLRQLLENLVGLSFNQEDLIKQFNNVDINTPKYVQLGQQQFKLKDDFKIVEDSLQALSKRVYQIESYVTEKVTEIKNNMRQGIDDLEERRKPQAADQQQRAMKNLNDLALMLSEVMNQMQQQMSGMMSGNQMCTNPGGQQGKQGNVPKDKMSQGQQSLNEQLKQMKQKLDKGQGVSSKEFAQAAARQSALRKALREKSQEMQKKGKGSKELQELIEQMDKVETELVNKRLNNDVLKRQEDILTRLLEHEKAERERDQDEKRKAEIAKNTEKRMPPSLEEYIKKREAEIEMYKTVSPALKPYYKFLVEEYFKSLNSK